MSAPLPALPPPVKVGGGGTRNPRDMIAVRMKTDGQTKAKMDDETYRTVNLPAGTLGFLLEDKGNDDFTCQFISPKTSNLCMCTVPKRVLEIGKPLSDFRIILPKIEQARLSSRTMLGRNDDITAKAIIAMWDDVHYNLDTLVPLGLRHVYRTILEEHRSKVEALEAIIGAFSSKSWALMNRLGREGFNVEAFNDISHMTPTNPHLQPDEEIIYLRIYRGPRCGSYAGRTKQEYPYRRQLEHETAIRSGKQDYYHYRIARKYPNEERQAFAIMKLKQVSPAVVAMAETTLACLLRTFANHLYRPTQDEISESATAGVLDSRVLTMSILKITDNALARVGFRRISTEGCNVALPLEDGSLNKREWVRYTATNDQGRGMYVYRYQVHTQADMAISLTFTRKPQTTPGEALQGFSINCELSKHPGVKPGMPVIVSVELMHDGKDHQMPYYRGPKHGAWSNCHELHSFSVHAEWRDEESGQWYSYPVQTKLLYNSWSNVPGEEAVTSSWRTATSILQFFKNRQYRNPPHYLQERYPTDIKELVYNHLDQSATLRSVPPTVIDIPTPVSFLDNVRALLEASDAEWRGIKIGPRPEGVWFKTSETKYVNHQRDCLICTSMPVVSKKALTKISCAKRDPFPIDANEGDRDTIQKGSCDICWNYYHRPCVWIKDGVPRINYIPQLPPNWQRLAFTPFYTGPAFPIKAPINLVQYAEIKEIVDRLADAENRLPNLARSRDPTPLQSRGGTPAQSRDPTPLQSRGGTPVQSRDATPRPRPAPSRSATPQVSQESREIPDSQETVEIPDSQESLPMALRPQIVYGRGQVIRDSQESISD